MGNISKNKKEDLIDKIDKIKNFLSDNEQNETTNLLIKYLYELEN